MRAISTAETMRIEVARISLGPEGGGLECSFEITRDIAIVRVFDEEPLRIGRPVSQVVGAAHALDRQIPPSRAAIARTEAGVGQRKLGIELNRPLEQWNPGVASA